VITVRQVVKGEYLLKKFPGKGGWTYADIPEIGLNKQNPFGWQAVSGTIDGYTLERIKLMPNGKGQLFLPVKADLRKAIKKEAGDSVKLVLYPDPSPEIIPDDIMACFQYEANHIFLNFKKLSESEKKAYLDWIAAAKKEDTKVDRITIMMKRLEKGLHLHQKEY
jgi:hypothetical protein